MLSEGHNPPVLEVCWSGASTNWPCWAVALVLVKFWQEFPLVLAINDQNNSIAKEILLVLDKLVM